MANWFIFKDDVVLAITTTGTVKVWSLFGKEQQTKEPIYENESKQIKCMNALAMTCCAYNHRTVLLVSSGSWQVIFLFLNIFLLIIVFIFNINLFLSGLWCCWFFITLFCECTSKRALGCWRFSIDWSSTNLDWWRSWLHL